MSTDATLLAKREDGRGGGPLITVVLSLVICFVSDSNRYERVFFSLHSFRRLRLEKTIKSK